MKIRTPSHKVYLTRTAFTWDIYDTVDGWRWLGIQVRVVSRTR